MATKIAFLEPDPFVNGIKNAQAFSPRLYNGSFNPKDTYYTSRSIDTSASADSLISGGNLVFTSEFNRTVTAARPLNGIMVKPNTHAVVHIRTAGGEVVKVFNRLGRETEDGVSFSKPPDGTTPNDDVWTDWLLQSVHEERTEKTQIVETFGETYLYAFGQHPRVLAFTGILLNTLDYNWRSIFWKNWDEFFRATQLIRANARMYITFDDVIVEGYPMNAAADQTSADPHVMSFSFSFFVTNYVNLTAQNGFKAIRDNINEVVRAGLSADYTQTGTAYGALGLPLDTQLPMNDLSTNRRPLFSALIPDVIQNLLYKGDSIPKQLSRLALGNDVDTTVAKAILATTQNGYAETQATSLVNTILDSALTNLSLYKHSLFAKLEDSIGANQGSINTWFGFLADIIEKKTNLPPSTSIAKIGPKMQTDIGLKSLKMFGMFVLVA